MQIHFDEGATEKIQPHLGDDKKLLLTFEDGVGPYSQHAMIHMQVQFSLNVVKASDPATDYDTEIDSNAAFSMFFGLINAYAAYLGRSR